VDPQFSVIASFSLLPPNQVFFWLKQFDITGSGFSFFPSFSLSVRRFYSARFFLRTPYFHGRSAAGFSLQSVSGSVHNSPQHRGIIFHFPFFPGPLLFFLSLRVRPTFSSFLFGTSSDDWMTASVMRQPSFQNLPPFTGPFPPPCSESALTL